MPDRIIRERALTSPTLDQLSAEAERLHWRLTVVADDHGRFVADPRVLLARCFPLRVGTLKAERLEAWRNELLRVGLIVLYTVGERLFGQYVTWATHQRTRESKSKHPAPEEGIPYSAAACGSLRRVAARARVPVSREPLAVSREPRDDTTRPPADPPPPGSTLPTWPSPAALVGLYNATAPDECPEVTTISPGRKRKANEYLAAFPDRAWWDEAFRQIGKSRFLRGLTPGRNGHKPFVADLDWLLSKGQDGSENCVKVYEGKYHD